MRRGIRASALLIAILVATGCAAQTATTPTPPAIDLGAYDPADGNGLWLVPGAEAAGLVTAAIRRAGPVSVSGEVTELLLPDPNADAVPGRSLQLTYAGDADAFTAQITAGDQRVEVLVSDGVSRVRGNAAYAASQGAPDTADRVVCTVGADAVVSRWDPLLDPAALVGALTAAGTVHVQTPLESDAATPDAVLDVVIGSEQAPNGVLTVARFGDPLPADFTAADAGGDGAFAFRGWGVPVDLSAAEAALPC